MKQEKTIAIVLAAGKGSRMQSEIQKQYMLLKEKPVLYYSLNQFQQSSVDEIILVVGKGEEEYCKKEIVEKYNITKVSSIIEGGKERYESVYHALQILNDTGFVLIHDAARPFLTQKLIQSCMENVKKTKSCVAAMPVKDTIKRVNEEGYAVETPNRSTLYLIQTPQCFAIAPIKEAYEKMIKAKDTAITDDAMVMEKYGNLKVKMIEGSYENIKITTPEDLRIGEVFLSTL